ncbi:MAG: hypothetical protein ACW98Y_09600 [Candidatus Thorarchaeota archaeon]|jgi:hypothetical protein
MNKGQVIFGLIAIASSLYVFVSIGILSRDEIVANPLESLLTVIFLPLGIVGFFLVLLNITTKTGVSLNYRPPSPSSLQAQVKKDPTHISRVVGEPTSGEEHIINGKPEWTYRNTLLSDWPFKSIPRSSEWFVKDERGNDISNTPLGQYNSIASLEYRAPAKSNLDEYREKLEDRSDEYTSIDQGVTYYD